MIDTLISEFSFVVNTAADSVDITSATTRAVNGDGKFTLQAGDNVNLLSCGITSFPQIPIAGKRNAEAFFLPFMYMTVNIYKTGSPTAIGQYLSYLPFMPYELSLGNFITVPDDSSYEFHNDFTIQSGKPVALTGLVGLPSSYNGKAFKVGAFVKISHTLPMV